MPGVSALTGPSAACCKNRGFETYHETVTAANRFLFTNSRDLTRPAAKYSIQTHLKSMFTVWTSTCPIFVEQKNRALDQEEVPALD